jgi:anti-sigma B factor antagonist
VAGGDEKPRRDERPEPDRVPRPGELAIETTTTPDRVVLSLVGEIDLTSAPTLEGALIAVESNYPREFVIDLEGVQFIDSTGLRVLLGATRRARAAAHELHLRRAHGQVVRLFEIAGVLDCFSFQGG